MTEITDDLILRRSDVKLCANPFTDLALLLLASTEIYRVLFGFTTRRCRSGTPERCFRLNGPAYRKGSAMFVRKAGTIVIVPMTMVAEHFDYAASPTFRILAMFKCGVFGFLSLVGAPEEAVPSVCRRKGYCPPNTTFLTRSFRRRRYQIRSISDRQAGKDGDQNEPKTAVYRHIRTPKLMPVSITAFRFLSGQSGHRDDNTAVSSWNQKSLAAIVG